MDISGLERLGEDAWRIPASGRMRVPAVIYADDVLVREMDEKVREQIVNVASLPGIVRGRLCHARRALGLRISDWRRGCIRS